MDKAINILSLVSYKFLPPDMGGQKGIAFFNRYLSKQTNLICVTIKENTQTTTEGYPIKNILSNIALQRNNMIANQFKHSGIVKHNESWSAKIEVWIGRLRKVLLH